MISLESSVMIFRPSCTDLLLFVHDGRNDIIMFNVLYSSQSIVLLRYSSFRFAKLLQLNRQVVEFICSSI